MSEAVVLTFGHRQYKLYTCYSVEHDCFTRGTSIMSTDKNRVQGIVVHSTAALNPNLKRYVQPPSSDSEFAKYFTPNNALGNNEQTYLFAELGRNTNNNAWNKPGDRTGFVHAFIGKNKAGEIAIANILPYNFACWGVGIHGPNFNYSPNGRIQFEICEDNDEEYVQESYWAAVVYCTYLCYRLRLDPNKVYATYVNNEGKETFPMTAYDANNNLSKDVKIPIICSHNESREYGLGSGHSDPENWWPNFPKLNLSMDKLREDVKSLYNQENGYQLLYNGQNIKNVVNKLSIYNTNNYVKNEISSTSRSDTATGSNVASPIIYSKDFIYIDKYVNYTDGWQYNTKPGMANIKLSKVNQNLVYNWCNQEIIDGGTTTMPYIVALAMFLQESGADWTARITGTGKANPEWADDGESYASYGMGMAKNYESVVSECQNRFGLNFYTPEGAVREAIYILASRIRQQYKYVKEHSIAEYTNVPYIGEDGNQHEFAIQTYVYSAFMLYNGGPGYKDAFPDPTARTHPQFYSGRCSRFVFGMSQYLGKQGVIK